MTYLAAIVSLSLIALGFGVIAAMLRAKGSAALAALANRPSIYLPPVVERRRVARAMPRVTGVQPVLRAAA